MYVDSCDWKRFLTETACCLTGCAILCGSLYLNWGLNATTWCVGVGLCWANATWYIFDTDE